jgi:phosphopantetheine--protein transferase-like protein
VAGRYCLAASLRAYDLSLAVLSAPNGRPALPPGIAASISHKGPISVAIVTTIFQGIGVDLEHVDENDRQLAAKVMTNSERDRCESGEEQTAIVTAHFAIKEAVYKAATDDEQEELEFEDIELGLTSSMLLAGRTWENVRVSVRRSVSEYRGYIFTDGPWVFAAATRL